MARIKGIVIDTSTGSIVANSTIIASSDFIGGYTGSTGYTGSRGTGYTGSAGSNGSTGYTGSVGSAGYTGSVGSAGTNGYTGSAGTNGYTGSASTAVGYTGSVGPTGPAGSGGSSIQSITGFYPGTSTAQTGTLRRYFAYNVTLVKIAAWVSSTSTSNVVIGLNRNGINTANVIIASNAYTSSTSLSANLIADTDYVTLDILSGYGTDIGVRLDYTSS